jgi:putative chitinase
LDIFDFIEKAFESFIGKFSPPPPQKVKVIYVPVPVAPTEAPPMPTNTATPKYQVTLEQLRKIMPICPVAKATAYLPLMLQAMEEFEINTPLRASAFIAQLAHESAQLRYFEEIADGSAYEGRKDLGNVLPGDGKRYKGRGPIQLTGRANYRDYGKELGLELETNPALAALPEIGFRTAGAFWKRKGLNTLADTGEFRLISVRINGINKKTGEPNGLADRIKYYTVAKGVLGVV